MMPTTSEVLGGRCMILRNAKSGDLGFCLGVVLFWVKGRLAVESATKT